MYLFSNSVVGLLTTKHISFSLSLSKIFLIDSGCITSLLLIKSSNLICTTILYTFNGCKLTTKFKDLYDTCL